MDRKYLEEHLSAYLDNELEPKKMREFEQALQAHPDLLEQVERLQRLNQLARESEVPMPAEGYFDNLAGRIEARIEREFPKERGKIVDFLLARRKTVAIISSVAAVLLITVISVEFYGPEREMYPGKFQKMIEIKSDTARPPVPAQMPKEEEKEDASRIMVKPPTVYGDTALGEARAKAVPEADVAAKDAVVTEEPMLKSSEQQVIHGAPSSLGAVETANLTTAKPAVEAQAETAKAPDTAEAGSVQKIVIDSTSGMAEPVTVPRDLLTPAGIVERSLKPKEQPKKLEKSAVSKQPQATSGESAMDDLVPMFAQPRNMDPENSKFIWPVGTAEYFERLLNYAIDSQNWDAVEAWPDERTSASSRAGDSVLEKRALVRPESQGADRPVRWLAERAYNTATEDDFSEQSCVYARVLITHFLKSSQVPDRDVWEARLDSVRIAESKYR